MEKRNSSFLLNVLSSRNGFIIEFWSRRNGLKNDCLVQSNYLDNCLSENRKKTYEIAFKTYMRNSYCTFNHLYSIALNLYIISDRSHHACYCRVPTDLLLPWCFLLKFHCTIVWFEKLGGFNWNCAQHTKLKGYFAIALDGGGEILFQNGRHFHV